MKRSGPPARRTPLRSGAPLRRQKPLRATEQSKAPRKPLKPVSGRRASVLGERAEVRRTVLARDGGCVGRGRAPGRCWHPADADTLDVHELVNRSAWRAGWLVPENCVSLCRRHHDWVTTHPDEAREVGLHFSREEAAALFDWCPPSGEKPSA